MRQYIVSRNVDGDGLIEVSGKDFRYLKNVLRLKVGDMVQLRLLDGSLSNSTVCRIDEAQKKLLLQVCAETKVAPPRSGENQSDYSNRTEIWLCMFIPKPSKFEQIVRQATECGVSKIIPVLSEFSASGAEKMNFRSERFERIVREARQQSGSPVATEVLGQVSLKAAVELWKNHVSECENVFSCVLYERSEKTTSIKKSLGGKKSVEKACIVCGSEGGISPSEIDFLSDHGFLPVHFDTNILRCETAALYGIAALQANLGE